MFNNNYLPALTSSDVLFFDSIDLSLQGIEYLAKPNSKNVCLSEQKSSEFSLKFKIPGYEKEDVKISIENKSKNFLYVDNYIKIKVVADNKEEGLFKCEKFLPSFVDQATIKASLKNGILTITARKDPQKTTEKQIEIT